MSHIIYQTEAVILKKRDVGEADRIFSFFTKDFGRLEIKAQGVRHLKSKLRYHLSIPAILRIAFVGTKNGYWRLVDVEELKHFKNVRTIELLNLLERLIQGQQKDEDVWKDLTQAGMVLDNNEFFALRFLKHLGYEGVSIKDALEQSML